MRTWTNCVLFALIVVGCASLAYGLNYMYFTDIEMTTFGDRIKFITGDTLAGPIRSNDCFAVSENQWSQFCCSDFFIMNCDTTYYASPWLVFHAPPLTLPADAATHRQQAIQQGHYFNAGPNMQARVQIMGDSLRIWWAPAGMPFDTAAFAYYPTPDTAVVFFDCPLNVFGTVSTMLILGARGTVGLEDNLVYASADSLTGIAPTNHSERFALVSEGEIKILNTWANGRENSGGRGRAQTNRDSTSIVLDGIYVALHESFTFAQQNDPDSGYVCTCSPDDRGTIYLYGSMIQKRRGYIHRGNRGSTGYLKQYRYDPSLRDWDLGLISAPENEISPASVDFGDVPVGQTVWDTVTVRNDFVPIQFDNILAALPFRVQPSSDSAQWAQRLIVGFSPTFPGQRTGTLTFRIPYYGQWFSVPLSGNAINLSVSDSSFIIHRSSFLVSAFPNPFNARTEIRFSVPIAEKVTMSLFDLTGRRVKTLFDQTAAAGEHSVPLNGTGLASGVYFVSMEAAGKVATQKILLLK